MTSRNDLTYPLTVPFMTVVQGDEFCAKGGNAAGLAALENITNQLINNSKPVVSEITLYGPCGYSQSTYESDINSLFGNIAATYPTKARNYFYGVMLDEEAGYNISVSELTNIYTVAAADANNFGSNVTIGDYIEAFAGCGDWTQSQFQSGLQRRIRRRTGTDHVHEELHQRRRQRLRE
jgi:hypothetical protein